MRIPADAFKLRGFRRWVHSDDFPTNVRAAFLDGEIEIEMSPEEIETHAKVKSDVHAPLWGIVRTEDLGDLFVDRVLLVNKEANVSNEPDLLFCSWESLRSGRVSYREWKLGSERFVEVCGSPDLTVEIVSRSSVHKDLKRLPILYYAAGVGECWLIDARGRRVMFKIYTRGRRKFTLVKADRDGYSHSPTFGRSFRLIRETNPLGRSRYTLLSR
ncbi:MAG TPA: Uma2 family endonuclease [Planctomycetaceae bacterium]|nr:Uma2 family endonuclease [Planctomycetaceae bacterium]